MDDSNPIESSRLQQQGGMQGVDQPGTGYQDPILALRNAFAVVSRPHQGVDRRAVAGSSSDGLVL